MEFSNNFLNYRLFLELDSTNLEAKRLAEKSHDELWILAQNQRKGRGRRGKQWLSGNKNFTASFLNYCSLPQSKILFKNYVAGIALYDSVLAAGVDSSDLTIKWPNDILLKKKKLGGVLIEILSSTAKNKTPLAVGFGLNLLSYPYENELSAASLPATSLNSAVDNVPSPEEFLKILMNKFSFWDEKLNDTGFAVIISEFLDRSLPIGKEILLNINEKTIEGKFYGINDYGALLLKTKSELLVVSGGDVSLIEEQI